LNVSKEESISRLVLQGERGKWTEEERGERARREKGMGKRKGRIEKEREGEGREGEKGEGGRGSRRGGKWERKGRGECGMKGVRREGWKGEGKGEVRSLYILIFNVAFTLHPQNPGSRNLDDSTYWPSVLLLDDFYRVEI
jgi:hypothetical protein